MRRAVRLWIAEILLVYWVSWTWYPCNTSCYRYFEKQRARSHDQASSFMYMYMYMTCISKKSLSVCHANMPLLFGGVFPLSAAWIVLFAVHLPPSAPACRTLTSGITWKSHAGTNAPKSAHGPLRIAIIACSSLRFVTGSSTTSGGRKQNNIVVDVHRVRCCSTRTPSRTLKTGRTRGVHDALNCAPICIHYCANILVTIHTDTCVSYHSA